MATAAEALNSSSAVVQEGTPEDYWYNLLFQIKEWLRLSKWLGKELLETQQKRLWNEFRKKVMDGI